MRSSDFAGAKTKPIRGYPIVRNKPNSQAVGWSWAGRIPGLACAMRASSVQNKANSHEPKTALTAFFQKGYENRLGLCAVENKANSSCRRRGRAGPFLQSGQGAVVSNKANFGRGGISGFKSEHNVRGGAHVSLGAASPNAGCRVRGDPHRVVACVRWDRWAAAPPRNGTARDGVDLGKTFAGELYWGPNSRA